MGKQNLNVSWDDSSSQTTVFIPETGSADVAIPPGATTVHIMEGPGMGRGPGRIAFEDCNSGAGVTESIHQVLTEGLEEGNRCNAKVHVGARPGEVIFYGLPLAWWSPDFQ
jgi:hypothetical protein